MGGDRSRRELCAGGERGRGRAACIIVLRVDLIIETRIK